MLNRFCKSGYATVKSRCVSRTTDLREVEGNAQAEPVFVLQMQNSKAGKRPSLYAHDPS